MSDDNVTQFPGTTLPENPIQVTPRQPGWCSHDSIVIDDHARSISCAKCAATLDPFNYLLSNAHGIARAWDTHRQVMRSANDLAERVSKLKGEEKRLRALIKRLQEKSGALVTVRGPRERL